VFGIGSFGLVVGIAVVTAVIATFLPVWNAARKKPVDSIRSL
jgi:ABC-type antimicrobial peptide transport system permease subunit